MNKLVLSVLMLVIAAACGRDEVARVDQKHYEVVQEGSASGVTSSLQGPGETLPPLTGTSSDTTTAFSIDPNAVAAAPSAARGTIGGTMPAQPPPSYPSPAPTYTPPAPLAEPKPQPTETDPQPQPQTMTDTATTPGPAPSPATEPEEEEEKEEPPPPTTTDTRGGWSGGL